MKKTNCLWIFFLYLGLAACVSKPVEVVPIVADTPKPKSKVEHKPKPVATQSGFYRVQPGDNLYRIGLRFNVKVTTLKQWNNLDDENQLVVGQLLQVVKNPPSQASSNTIAAPTPHTLPELSRMNFIWPTSGKVINEFNGNSNRGINIATAAGSSVVAAADGNVAYTSDDVKGYGKVIIIKHNAHVLSTYTNNRAILVKLGQNVKKGEKIAETGTLDDGTEALHFELRSGQNAVNPLSYLPQR